MICEGELDRNELSELMKSIGLEMSEKRIDEVMFTYDVDGGILSRIHYIDVEFLIACIKVAQLE